MSSLDIVWSSLLLRPFLVFKPRHHSTIIVCALVFRIVVDIFQYSQLHWFHLRPTNGTFHSSSNDITLSFLLFTSKSIFLFYIYYISFSPFHFTFFFFLLPLNIRMAFLLSLQYISSITFYVIYTIRRSIFAFSSRIPPRPFHISTSFFFFFFTILNCIIYI